MRKLKEEAYVELTCPNSDCIQSDDKVSVCFQCLEPWQVRLGNPEVHINTNRIWESEQHYFCYHEVTVEDSNCSSDTLECTVEASFWSEGDGGHGDVVLLVISHPLQSDKAEVGAAAHLIVGIPDLESQSSSTPGKDIGI